MRGKGSSINVSIQRAEPRHAGGIYRVICVANRLSPEKHWDGCIDPASFSRQLECFPEGQFVALSYEHGEEKVVGLASAMRTPYPPSARPLSWRDMIGDLGLAKHDPEGRWLYGVEKAVHPDYQGMGVGSALYHAQFDLIRRLGLAGMYAGGMLKGYRNYRHLMSLRSYAGKVMRGELRDPTLSMQFRRGFKPRTFVENYSYDPDAGHGAVLIVWEDRPKPRLRPVSAAEVRR